MAKGKGIKAALYCKECNREDYETEYVKKKGEEMKTEFKKFCRKCRKHVVFKRKDIKKASK